MPQMAPLMWFSLFLLFSSLFIFTMIKIYFFINKEMNMKFNLMKNNMTPNLNWKW